MGKAATSGTIRTREAAPHAAMLIESMRDIGYSLETALADIIDNSITAKATAVRLLADTTSGEPSLAILDNGDGMSEDELLAAMRPGSRNPLDTRDKDDLGRFGLGLKTASFSQCRKLTVASRKGGVLSCARWNLDEVAQSNRWLVEFLDDTSALPWIDELGATGTLVIWESLDRLVEGDGADARSAFVARIDYAAEHLELVFHRFLAGERGLTKITLSLNGRKLSAFDPFHSSHLATQAGPVEKIRSGGQEVEVQTFTLPHHKKVLPSDWDRYAGKAGYLKNQGFYVYRGKRLIIHGTWFGLARQKELTKLARVRIDMPNGMDADWKIDVKKASAQPPYHVRERLRRIIETIGATSRRVYTARGHRLASDSRLPVWQRRQNGNEISYCLNPEHPVFADFSERLPDDLKTGFRHVLEMAATSIPIDALFADISAHPENVSGTDIGDDTLEHVVETTFAALLTTGVATEDAVEMMRVTDPFRENWEIVSQQIQKMMEHHEDA
jgi:hypothetical protein